MTRAVVFTFTAFATLLASACGTEDPGDSMMPTTGSIFPIAVGHSWEFRLTDNSGVISTKVQTVTGTAAAGGMPAFRFLTVRGDRETESIQRIDAQGQLIRISEINRDAGLIIDRIRFTPPMVRVSTEQIALDDTYQHEHTEEHLDGNGTTVRTGSKKQTFIIEAVDELIMVPAGNFECVRVRRDTENGPTKTYWYAPGVGKVKEIGGQTEELVRFEQ